MMGLKGLKEPVPGLTGSQPVRIMFSGVVIVHLFGLITAAIPQGCTGPLDVTFIVDASESIVEYDPHDQPLYHWALLQRMLTQVVQSLPVDSGAARLSVITYSQQPERLLHLADAQTAGGVVTLLQDAAPARGSTNTAAALWDAQNMFYTGRPDARRVAVLFSDGLSNTDRASVQARAQDLKNWADIHTVAMTSYIDEAKLRQIASDSENFLQVRPDLIDFYAQTLAHRICDLPDPTPPTPAPPNCEFIADLAFLADNSGSIRDNNIPEDCPNGDPCDNYQILKEFLISLARDINVGKDDTRVATVRFSEIAELVFDLDDHPTLGGVEQGLLDMPFRGSYTNIAHAINIARTRVFTQEHGDRPDVRNVIILITDGHSTRQENQTLIEADMAKSQGISFFVVGMTNEVDLLELRSISSEPVHQHFFETADVRSLSQLKEELVRLVCAGGGSRKRRSLNGGRASRTQFSIDT